MVNWTKRAQQGAAGILYPGESVIAGTKLTQEQFQVVGGGMTGGMIAGGAVGALVGAAWDKRLESKRRADEASRPRATVDEMPVRSVEFPRNGAIAAVTSQRLLFFKASELGKAKDLFYQAPTASIRSVHERDLEKKLLRGTPPSRLVVIEFDDHTTLPVWGLTGPGNSKWLDSFTAGVRQAAGIG